MAAILRDAKRANSPATEDREFFAAQRLQIPRPWPMCPHNRLTIVYPPLNCLTITSRHLIRSFTIVYAVSPDLSHRTIIRQLAPPVKEPAGQTYPAFWHCPSCIRQLCLWHVLCLSSADGQEHLHRQISSLPCFWK